uniref:Uncharacterized protein n=1 Tax=Globisporangium ultimum (strain ATCC 200006 / CBS 805.95 / DAOM BR144) TaxID=431595 RepID=K3X4T9_GLOUD
ERGRAFRDREKSREENLIVSLHVLKDEIQRLAMRRSLYGECALLRRHTDTGSLVQLTRTYYTLFQNGLGTPQDDRSAQYQKELFLRQHVHPDTVIGDAYGLEALIEQWRLYTMLYDAMYVTIVHVSIAGSEENPVVSLDTTCDVRITMNTLRTLFSHVLDNAAVVNALLGKRVVFKAKTLLQFSPDGRIRFCDAELSYVTSFHTA